MGLILDDEYERVKPVVDTGRRGDGTMNSRLRASWLVGVGLVASAVLAAEPDGTPIEIEPSQAGPERAAASGEPTGQAEGAPAAQKGGGEEPVPKAPPPVVRPGSPPKPPNRAELDVEPDQAGRVRFNFTGQAWPDVLQWLAENSQLSLDWQQMPGDFLNLVTHRTYTLEEARDILNMHLLDRGYTLLLKGEMLTVTAIERIDPSRVPRVRPEDLEQHSPHEFVKTSFKLDWLLAQKAVAELMPMLSKNGRMTPLTETNRLEAMDAVVNLQEIYQVLREEQSGGSETRLVREFVIQHSPAAEILAHLQKLLGLESRKVTLPPPGSVPPEVYSMMANMAQQQSPEGGWADSEGEPPVGGAEGNVPLAPRPRRMQQLKLLLNPRRNSILAHATPDKMALIAETVQVLDVPKDDRGALLDNVSRTQIYRLRRLKADMLIKTLLDSGDLDPQTRLQADDEGRALIVAAPLADHLVIASLVEKLEGSGRRFEVVRLRGLPADEVAGTIAAMMGAEREAPWVLGPEATAIQTGYPVNPMPPSPKQDPPDRFRVEADVRNNRVLLWANEFEMREVTTLLGKLGEPLTDEGTGNVRVLDIDPTRQQEALELLRKHWPETSPNPLELPSEPAAPRPGAPSAQWYAPEAAAYSPVTATPFVARTVQQDRPAKEPGAAESPPPVKVTVTPDGQWIISSRDASAIDRLEALLSRYRQPRLDYRIFELQHASASWLSVVLKQFFYEDEPKTTSVPTPPSQSAVDPPQPGLPQPLPQKPATRLSKRRAVKIIADSEMNSLLVRGADGDQLQMIARLVEYYDQAPAPGSEPVRVTDVFPVRYSTATGIAATLREVYKDLLSETPEGPSKDGGQPQLSSVKRPSFLATFGEREVQERRTVASFHGRLSVGVDEATNVLVVSADGSHLLQSVGKMIEALDRAAVPLDAVQVVRLPAGTNPDHLRRSLAGVLGQKLSIGSESAVSKPQDEVGRDPRRPSATTAPSSSSTSSEPRREMP